MTMSDVALHSRTRIPPEQIAQQLRALRVPDELVQVHLDRLARWRSAYPPKIVRYRSPDELYQTELEEQRAFAERRRQQKRVQAERKRQGKRRRRNGT
jgi:hypothetical protein